MQTTTPINTELTTDTKPGYRKLKAMTLRQTTLEFLDQYCHERKARVPEVIEAIMQYWIANDFEMDTAMHTTAPKNQGKRGTAVKVDYRAKLQPALVKAYEAKRSAKGVSKADGIPFGASIECCLLEWLASEGDNFIPAVTGKRYKPRYGAVV